MIEGVVNAFLEAVIVLSVRGPTGEPREIEAVVDTGFNGVLTLPPELVRELGMPFLTTGVTTLADGSEHTFNVYDGAVRWEGQWRSVDVDAADTTPLVGMRLLEWHDLLVQVRDGGRVAIEAVA